MLEVVANFLVPGKPHKATLPEPHVIHLSQAHMPARSMRAKPGDRIVHDRGAHEPERAPSLNYPTLSEYVGRPIAPSLVGRAACNIVLLTESGSLASALRFATDNLL